MAEASSPASPGLTTYDLVRIGVFSLLLFLIVPISGRILTGHESVQPETSREMYQGGDWIIPTMGGDPWLERPPIPSWFICGVYAVVGVPNSDAVARIAAILVAVPIVLLVAGIGSRLYGRDAGILAGLICATMQEFYTYASNPEADIYLTLIVTGVLAVFVRLELGLQAERPAASTGFFGRRTWLMAAFFALLGATNMAKGVIFGSVMAGLPVAGYLLWNRSRPQIRRYLWLWGWLLALAVAAAWPLLVVGRYPEIIELWKEHYGGRLNSGYLREPWWYYLAYVPMVAFPWTLPALLGLWSTRKAAFAGPGRERFLWCWALIPPAVFSLSDGKHHHYLLQCLAPWAVFSVVGLRELWQFCRDRFPGWLREPLLPAAVWGAAAAAALVSVRHKIPGGLEFAIIAGAYVPIAAFILARSLVHPNPTRAFAGTLALVVAGYALWGQYQVRYLDHYGPDLAFVREASRLVPADSTVNVQFDWVAPLETFWVLYHSPRPALTIRDPWQLAERSAGRDCAYILTRRSDIERLSIVGEVTTVLESQLTRNEKDPSERRVLCRVTFRPNIPPPPEEYLRTVRRTLW